MKSPPHDSHKQSRQYNFPQVSQQSSPGQQQQSQQESAQQQQAKSL